MMDIRRETIMDKHDEILSYANSVNALLCAAQHDETVKNSKALQNLSECVSHLQNEILIIARHIAEMENAKLHEIVGVVVSAL
jgi:hypothetical protein